MKNAYLTKLLTATVNRRVNRIDIDERTQTIEILWRCGQHDYHKKADILDKKNGKELIEQICQLFDLNYLENEMIIPNYEAAIDFGATGIHQSTWSVFPLKHTKDVNLRMYKVFPTQFSSWSDLGVNAIQTNEIRQILKDEKGAICFGNVNHEAFLQVLYFFISNELEELGKTDVLHVAERSI